MEEGSETCEVVECKGEVLTSRTNAQIMCELKRVS